MAVAVDRNEAIKADCGNFEVEEVEIDLIEFAPGQRKGFARLSKFQRKEDPFPSGKSLCGMQSSCPGYIISSWIVESLPKVPARHPSPQFDGPIEVSAADDLFGRHKFFHDNRICTNPNRQIIRSYRFVK